MFCLGGQGEKLARSKTLTNIIGIVIIIMGDQRHCVMRTTTKALGLFGNPRRGGNADLLLEEILRRALAQGAEIERVFLSQCDISGCLECRSCDVTGNCVIEDQMQKLYQHH